MSFPILNAGFFKPVGGGIPSPGTCTPYSVPIPVTTDLLSYVSPYNSCDQFNTGARTGALSANGDPVGYVDDISGLGNDVSVIGVGSAAAAEYVDNGDGDVYWASTILGSRTLWYYTNSSTWRLNNQVKTIMFLGRKSTYASQSDSSFGYHWINGGWQVRNSGGPISLFADGTQRISSLSPTVDTWHVFTVRCNDNVVLSLDTSHEQVYATTPNIADVDLSLFGSGPRFWVGDVRDITAYSSSLSDTDVDTMVAYMKTKWGLP
jgi:hypothetical protein